MKYKIVTIRDRAADVYGAPNFVASIGGSIREFGDVVNGSKDSPIARHPEDFDLYELGTYDDETAKFEQKEQPRQIAIGKDLKRSTDSA